MLFAMESKENIMARTMIARDPIIAARRIYTKGIIIVTRSFMISSTSYPWA